MLSQQVGPFMWGLFFCSAFFWFKEQEKQTESNPLSSQPRLDAYQLRVIMMSLSSGVNRLRSHIKYNFGLRASRQGSSPAFTPRGDCIFRNFIYRPIFAVAATIPVNDVLQQILSRVSLCNLLNAAADNYAALVFPTAGHRPAETGDAPERFRSD